MTQRARRIYYSLAFVVFLILAPIILALAQGYQWAGWRAGFVPTGVLVVSSTARATVSINNHVEDVTDKLTKRLRPGQYQIELRRSGYTSWKTLISIKANVAHVIGPVVLFPEVLPVSFQGDSVPVLLTDPIRRVVVSATPSADGWDMQQLWPRGPRWTVSIPDQPTTVGLSPRQRVLVATTNTQSFIASLTSSTAPWTIEPIDRIFWGDRGDAVLYAHRGPDVLILDTLTKSETVIAARSSANWFDQQLWSTELIDGQTLLYRQTAEALEPILVRDFVGRWLIEPSPDGVLFIRNQDNHQAIAYTGRTDDEPVALGVVDAWWWPDRNEPPLWQAGTQLYTLAEGQPLLLERGPEQYQSVVWIVPEHILASHDGQTLMIRSVSSRQGRSVIIRQQLSVPSAMLSVDRGRNILLLRTNGTPSSLYTLSWE